MCVFGEHVSSSLFFNCPGILFVEGGHPERSTRISPSNFGQMAIIKKRQENGRKNTNTQPHRRRRRLYVL
jgi:hypothetical protein